MRFPLFSHFSLSIKVFLQKGFLIKSQGCAGFFFIFSGFVPLVSERTLPGCHVPYQGKYIDWKPLRSHMSMGKGRREKGTRLISLRFPPEGISIMSKVTLGHNLFILYSFFSSAY